jgi:hypothetical protein
MNAYELAEKWELSLEVWDDRDYTSWCYDASSMLRQQADRITELERFIKDRGETCAFIVWSNTRGKE